MKTGGERGTRRRPNAQLPKRCTQSRSCVGRQCVTAIVPEMPNGPASPAGAAPLTFASPASPTTRDAQSEQAPLRAESRGAGCRRVVTLAHQACKAYRRDELGLDLSEEKTAWPPSGLSSA